VVTHDHIDLVDGVDVEGYDEDPIAAYLGVLRLRPWGVGYYNEL
jgi:hypothetical protein